MRLQKVLQEWNANVLGDVGVAMKKAEVEMVECQNAFDLHGDAEARVKLNEAIGY